MQVIRTIWQPSYTPLVFAAHAPKIQLRWDVDKTKSIVLDYLEKHGITEKRDLLKNIGMSISRLNHGLHNLGGLIAYEQSGANANRKCSYWAISNPPRLNQRCASFQAMDFISRNPWCYASKIPSEIIPTPRNRHMCVLTLETAGRLISRVENGRKQYKVAA